jgi:hypothetical protein
MKINRVKIGEAILFKTPSHGDCWDTTWAEDNKIYCVSDDTYGFDNACHSNLAIHVLTGDKPENLEGKTINPMDDYGAFFTVQSEDNACWKAQGITCVDGVLFLSVSRHGYSITNPYLPYPIQETWDASIVKSEDKGLTWSTAPELGQSMFPGRTFSTPYFIEYGQNGDGAKDGGETYVYAVSNDGAWNNGNYMTMGRVKRELIGRLDANNWEFIHDYAPDGEPVWKPGHLQAKMVFRAPGKTSMTGIHYLKGLDLYIMPQWHYYKLDDTRLTWKERFNGTRLEFYSSPKPWGPWTLFHYEDFKESWYSPMIPSKLISEDGKSLTLIVSGGNWEGVQPYYRLWMLPMTLETV